MESLNIALGANTYKIIKAANAKEKGRKEGRKGEGSGRRKQRTAISMQESV